MNPVLEQTRGGPGAREDSGAIAPRVGVDQVDCLLQRIGFHCMREEVHVSW